MQLNVTCLKHSACKHVHVSIARTKIHSYLFRRNNNKTDNFPDKYIFGWKFNGTMMYIKHSGFSEKNKNFCLSKNTTIHRYIRECVEFPGKF